MHAVPIHEFASQFKGLPLPYLLPSPSQNPSSSFKGRFPLLGWVGFFMEFTTELCLAPRRHHHHHVMKTKGSSEMSSEHSSGSESNNYNVGKMTHSRKRKMTMIEMMGFNDRDRDHVVDLQHHLDQEVKKNNNRHLPLDWEQCLDLHSGTMYYFNRKTSRKSWSWPKDTYHDDHESGQNSRSLDLELNISSSNKYYNNNMNDHHHQHNMKLHHRQIPASPSPSEEGNFSISDGSSSSPNDDKDSNMVALACLNCHLLVILSKSSPCCPNCKFVHSLPPTVFHHNYPPQPNNNVQFPPRPMSTLSILN